MTLDQDTRGRLSGILERAHLNLVDNVLPFWARNAWDAQYGGFLTRLDRQGRRLEEHEKFLMMQVRMIASLSWAHQYGLTDRGYLDMAGEGFKFLVKHFWDAEEGGFHFSVTREGAPLCRRKNTDFHAYALTGLVAFHEASGRPEPLAWAVRVFDLLQEKARDGDLGYIEDFDSGTWPALNADQMHLGAQQAIKTIDMHTNVLEGFTYLARVTRQPEHLAALKQVLELILARGIDPESGATYTAFDRDWRPVPDAQGKLTTSYGINVELAWLLLEAVDVLGAPRDVYRAPILGLLDHALDYGFDHGLGGLAAYGPMRGHVLDTHDLKPDRHLRAWWEQAELMNALVDALEWTGDSNYLDAFLKLCDWIWAHQIDHEHGDWYQDIDPATREPLTTDKGGEWKTAFHVSRALIRSIAAIKRLLKVAC